MLAELLPVSPRSLKRPEPDNRELDDEEVEEELEDDELEELEDELDELEVDEELRLELELVEDEEEELELVELLESLEDDELRSFGSRMMCSSHPFIPVSEQNTNITERTVRMFADERD